MALSVRKKLGVVAIAGVAAVGCLVGAAALDASTVQIPVDECVARAEQLLGKKIRLMGRVADGSITVDTAARQLRFVLSHNGEKIQVIYRGTAPDTFQEGRNAVAIGRLVDPRTLEADQLLTKCASKYESMPETGDRRSGSS